MIFYFFWVFVICQRLFELVVARGNEKWMKDRGAIEFGQGHYPLIVMVHTLFFIVLFAEVFIFNHSLTPFWPVLLPIFILSQAGRLWALSSLGRFWNTKIIVMPHADVVKKGPYRLMRHPNYLIVTLEFIIIPLLFHAYYTALVFTILNFVILLIRIPAEEEALKQLTEYEEAFPRMKSDSGIGKI
ncbi:isoprenylcysteine carboxyl methyltransferase family protein [Cytobacillus purgationiresistens]|uniref:Methyltransferase n=1 Tax=Cytobacillus purgationiresistens TaxID=863449 RepID=A0ABU0ALC1_9BACI|nr:isoprenylcysteine carboxylmethyltransferase family protein [Cytobacillus purgationiresistens]MDQ0272066.1 methyltransferase [Cytobacillus purgationiresistens]